MASFFIEKKIQLEINVMDNYTTSDLFDVLPFHVNVFIFFHCMRLHMFSGVLNQSNPDTYNKN